MKEIAELKGALNRLLRLVKKNLQEEAGLPSGAVKEALDQILQFNFSKIKGKINWPEISTLIKNMADLSSLIGVYRIASSETRPARFDKKSLEVRCQVTMKFLARDLENLNWKYLMRPARQNPEYLEFLELRARITVALSPPDLIARPSDPRSAIAPGFTAAMRKVLGFMLWMALWFCGLWLYSRAGGSSFFRTHGIVKVLVLMATIVVIFGWFWFSGRLMGWIWKKMRKFYASLLGSLKKTGLHALHLLKNLFFRIPVSYRVRPVSQDHSRVILEPLVFQGIKSGLPRDSHGFRLGQKIELSRYPAENGGGETGLTFYRVVKSPDIQVDCGVNSEGYIIHIRVTRDQMRESDQQEFRSNFQRRFRKYRIESRSGFMQTHIYVDNLTEVSLLMVPGSNLLILNMINIIETGAVPRFCSGHTLGDVFLPEKREYWFLEKRGMKFFKYKDGPAVITLGIDWKNRIGSVSWMAEGMNRAGAARLARFIHRLCGDFLEKKKGQKKPELTLGSFFVHQFRDGRTVLTIIYDRGLWLMNYADIK